uniref:BTB domain-containing protein n=1 Tax=Alexandrium monilatum TaxID=311494 RepID=A0A7S4SSS0_9DINO|mmetsp:Transcript_32203/g.100508  ORF Transcript_32203/g.100508 Transcript_32203/m.100508 type:complete len:726 (+) Transcript_32203:53-2230(+)
MPSHASAATPQGSSFMSLREMLPSPTASSLRDSTKRGTRRSLKAKIAGVQTGPADELRFVPEASRGEENGWQLKCEDVKSRIGALFNCYTMSDVVFQVDAHRIPAHKFVIAAASPVWYKQLYEEGNGERDYSLRRTNSLTSNGGSELWFNGGRHTVLPIEGVPHLAFYEFLQYIYTDDVNVTLGNVLPLILLSDTYKVPGLSERCMEFLKSEVTPTTVLRVLHILRMLTLKACVSLWKALVLQAAAIRKFRELTLAERRAKMEENISMGSTMSGRASLRSSVASGTPRRHGSMASRSILLRSSRGSIRSSGFYANSEAESLMGEGEFGDAASVLDVAQNYARKAFRLIQSHGLEARLLAFVVEVSRRCWRTVQEETAAVISSSDMWDQDARMLREILSLESLSVPEISLFRAIVDWAKRKCAMRGSAPTIQNVREVIGEDTLLLLRFPTMSADQFEWEVVPTGLLAYEDVEQLLSSITKRSTVLGRFNGKPRTNINFRVESSDILRGGSSNEKIDGIIALNSAYEDSMKTIWNAVPDDPVDSILGSKLLRSHLRSKVLCDHGETRVTVSEAEIAQQASGARLPPIQLTPVLTPRHPSRPSRCTSAADRHSAPNSPTARHSAPDSPKAANRSLLEKRIEEPTEGSRPPLPEDFVRICRGLYAFRGTSLIELWLEDGEVMCMDHGPSGRLEDPQFDDALPEVVRQRLGLPSSPPLGRGVFLDEFLSR